MGSVEIFSFVGVLAVVFFALLGLVNAAAVVLARNFVPACREIGRSVYRRQERMNSGASVHRIKMRQRITKRIPVTKPNGKEAAV